MAVWSQRGEGSGSVERSGREPRDLDLLGEHLHYDRAARAWRTHAELAQTRAALVTSAPDAAPVGAR